MHNPLAKKNRIIQLETTTRCCETCSSCTRALAQSPKLDMPLDLFEQAVLACKDWILRENGVLALFGGNCVLWPHFDAGLDIITKHLPSKNIGLWSNNLHGKGALIAQKLGRGTYYNIVTHGNKKAEEEVRRELPWVPVHGTKLRPDGGYASHASIFLASQDFMSEEELWERQKTCTYDVHWSAIVMLQPPDYKTLGGFSCEIAGTHARVNGLALGVPVVPGWLDQPAEHFKWQYLFACPRCSGMLNLDGVPDVGPGQKDQFSKTNSNVMQLTWSKKRKVEMLDELPAQDNKLAIKYL